MKSFWGLMTLVLGRPCAVGGTANGFLGRNGPRKPELPPRLLQSRGLHLKPKAPMLLFNRGLELGFKGSEAGLAVPDTLNGATKRNPSLPAARAYSSYKTDLEPTSSPSSTSSKTSPPTPSPKKKKTTVSTLHALRSQGTPITMMTAYDFPTGRFVDRAGVDVCLVGDSLGMVALGMNTTEGVTLDMMAHHSLAVSRGLSPTGPLLLSDLPFGSYEASPAQAIASTVRLIQEGKAEMVKMEGGEDILECVAAVAGKLGAAVCGHVGLMPQRAGKLGGYKVQAKTSASAKSLVSTALALQQAGISLLVLECIPPPVAAAITKLIDVPTIGIGAGNVTDGQVLVMGDAMTFTEGTHRAKFAKQFLNASPLIVSAIENYNAEVRSRAFPGPLHVYAMESEDEKLEFEEWAAAEVEKKARVERDEAEKMKKRSGKKASS